MKLRYLFLLGVCFLILCITSVLTYYFFHLKMASPYFHNPKPNGKHSCRAETPKDEMSLDYTMHWPEINIFFQSETLNECLFVSWKGAVKKKDRYLFVFTRKEAFSAFLSACSRIFEENKVPGYMFDAVYMEGGSVSLIQKEILVFMQKYHYSYQGVIEDNSQFSHLAGLNCTSALVGIGYSGTQVYSYHGDSADFDWASQLAYRMFPSKKDDYLNFLLKLLNQTYELHVSFGLWQSKVDTVCKMLPESSHWFYPVIEKSEDTIRLYYENDVMMKENEEILTANARKNGITIKKETESKSCSFYFLDSKLFECCKNAVHHVYHEDSIPVYMNVPFTEQLHLGCNVIHFAPILNNSRYGAADSILFYEQFLQDSSL